MARLHYVPRFLLEGFADPTVTSHASLWFFQKSLGEWKTSTPRDLAVRKDFYVFRDKTGARRTEVEDFFAFVEGDAASLLTKRVFRQRLLTREQRLRLAGFITVMISRVPAEATTAQELIEAAAHAEMKTIVETLQRDPEALHEYRERYRRDTGREVPDLSDLHMDDVKVEFPLGAAVGHALEALPDVASLIATMGWTFWFSRGSDYFISSNFPVGWMDPVAGGAQVGLHPRFGNVEVTFALSRSVAVAAGWGRYDTTRFQDAPREVVEEINVRSAMRATVVYAPARTFPGSDLLMQGDGCWASAPDPKLNVTSLPVKDGHLVAVSPPDAWLPLRRKSLIVTAK